MYGYDWNIDASDAEDFARSRDAMERGYTDALAPRSAATILGDVVDLDENPDAMAAFILG